MDLKRALMERLTLNPFIPLFLILLLKGPLVALKEPILIITGLCTFLSFYFTTCLVLCHWFRRANWKEKFCILVIIQMVPAYGLTSFCALNNPTKSYTGLGSLDFDMQFLKEYIEAAAMMSYMELMCTYLKISNDNIPYELRGTEIHHHIPMTFFLPETVFFDLEHSKLLRKWTKQYLYVQAASSLLIRVLGMFNLYPNWLNWIYIPVINISMSLALYSLIIFHRTFASERIPHSRAKLAVIKGVVFLCFWQGLLLEILTSVGAIKAHYDWLDIKLSVKDYIQNVLICGEMVIFTLVQFVAFPPLCECKFS